MMSLTNCMNNRCELGPHCFRPMLELKNSEKEDLYLTHDLIVRYIDLIALTS